MKQNNLLLFRVVAALICLVVVTSSMVSGQFARYSTGDNGVDWADVASFNVGISCGTAVDNGLIKDYPVTISNDSEVKVGFSRVHVQFQDALPTNISLVLTDKDGNELCAAQQTDSIAKEYTFLYASELAPHTNEVIHLRVTQSTGGVFDAFTTTTKLTVAVYQIN